MYGQMHYFDTNSFEPPDEDDNILLCMNNEVITILDDDDCVIVPPPHIKEKCDDECILVTPPQVNLSPDTPNKPIKVSANKPDFESLRPLFGWLPTDIIK